MKNILVAILLATLASVCSLAKADTLKLAFIDQLSGNFADIGETSLHQFEYVAEQINASGGLKDGTTLEILSYDTRGSVRTAQRRLREAIEDGARVILQGNSSHVANGLTNAIARHNETVPDDPVIFLNFAAVDPALTNENCNFWHFRFDVHSDMKVAALVNAMLDRNPDLKRVFLINQDYGFGHAVAETATRLLGELKPDAEVVASVFHPVGVVEDFAPYAEQIDNLNPDAVITGNWGNDIYRLVFAIDDRKMDVPIYTLNGGGAPISEVIKERGNDRILLAHGGVYNPAPKSLIDITEAYQEKFPEFRFNTPRIKTTLDFFVKAFNEVGSADIAGIASALENMELTTVAGDTVHLRASDHQLIGPVRVSAQSSTGVNLPMDEQGFGMKTVYTMSAEAVDSLPGNCAMDRP